MSNASAEITSERLAQLVENLNDGLRVLENGRTTYVNRRLCEITGYSKQELLESSTDLIYDEENWNIAKQQLARRPQGESSSYEVFLLCKDGTQVPVIISAHPVYDEQGRWCGACSVFTVISKQHETERELRESEARFRDFAEIASDRYWEQDDHLRFSFITDPENECIDSPVGEHIRQRVLGKTRWELVGVDPSSDERWRRHRDDLLARRPFRDFRYVAPDAKDGRITHWRISGRPIFDQNGKFRGYRGTAADETKEHRAQQEALRAQRRLYSAIDSISEGFAYFDAEDRLVLCNKRYREIFPEISDILRPGMKFEECLRAGIARGMTTPDELDPDSFLKERMQRHRNPGDGFVIRLSGNRWVQVVERRTDDGGIVGVWTDITELKQREQQLSQSQKMEALGQLTGGIAHDFNNLLAVVLGNLELMQAHVGGDERLARYIDRSITGASRGAALTQRLLAFSRKHPLHSRATDVTNLIHGMNELLKSSLGESIRVQYELSADLWNAHADPNQLETVLLNLVVNARDAMVDGGTLIIRTANRRRFDIWRTTRAGYEHEDYVMLSVVDTGLGMSTEVQDRIFEPFFTTKDVSQGSGLGMSIVYGFVQQSKGHIEVQSEEGRGTTISLYLPRARMAEAQTEEVAQPKVHPQGNGELILVVEDDADVRELVLAMLSGLGYEVREAADAETALEILKGGLEVDLLFSDVVLPGELNGPELVKQVKEFRPDLAYLFMSGYTQHAGESAAVLDQTTNLLHKPFLRGELAERIQRALGNRVNRKPHLRLAQS